MAPSPNGQMASLVTRDYLSLELARMESRFNRALLILAGFITAVAGVSLAAAQLLD